MGVSWEWESTMAKAAGHICYTNFVGREEQPETPSKCLGPHVDKQVPRKVKTNANLQYKVVEAAGFATFTQDAHLLAVKTMISSKT